MANKTVTCVDVHGAQHQVAVSALCWRPSAYAIIIKDGKLLVSPQFNGYDLPGGGVDLGELPEDAAVRETKEETGINVENPTLVSIETSFFKPFDSNFTDGKALQAIMMYYSCAFKGGELSTDGFDEYEKQYARMPEWLALDELDNISIASSVDWRQFVRKVIDANSRH